MILCINIGKLMLDGTELIGVNATCDMANKEYWVGTAGLWSIVKCASSSCVPAFFIDELPAVLAMYAHNVAAGAVPPSVFSALIWGNLAAQSEPSGAAHSRAG